MGRNRNKGGSAAGAVVTPAIMSASIPSGWMGMDGDSGIMRKFGDVRAYITPENFERPGRQAYFTIEVISGQGMDTRITITDSAEASWEQLTAVANKVGKAMSQLSEIHALGRELFRSIDNADDSTAALNENFQEIQEALSQRVSLNAPQAYLDELDQTIREFGESIAMTVSQNTPTTDIAGGTDPYLRKYREVAEKINRILPGFLSERRRAALNQSAPQSPKAKAAQDAQREADRVLKGFRALTNRLTRQYGTARTNLWPERARYQYEMASREYDRAVRLATLATEEAESGR